MEAQVKVFDPHFMHRSFEQTMKILDCSRSFIYTQIREGKLNPKKVGRKPYFSLKEINSLIENS